LKDGCGVEDDCADATGLLQEGYEEARDKAFEVHWPEQIPVRLAFIGLSLFNLQFG
jgi:hypothetical protein